MEKRSLLPIVDKGHKAAVVIEVQDSLNGLLDSHGIVNEESEQINELLSIYKIPDFMRENNPKAFEPQLVSFGPYHYGKQHLLPMELEKIKALHRFKTNYGLDVASIVESVSSILEDLQGSYNNLEEAWMEGQGRLLHLMIVDGCFMLEFFNECPMWLDNMSRKIRRDMLLLENQLPMKLLNKLHSIAHQNQPLSKDLKSLICGSLCISEEGLMPEYMHILDMYKASLLYPSIDRTDRSVTVANPESPIIPSATRLRDAGIKFEKSKSNSLTDVHFDEKRGVLSLPQLVVVDDTEWILLNVMAFETLMPDAGNQVSSFIFIIGNLIKEDKDVALLSSQGILSHALGADYAVTDMFSVLAKSMVLHSVNRNSMTTAQQLNWHCNKPWNVWWASLKDPRTQKPWVVVSIAAASLGFLLQIIQTVYGVYGYHRPNHS